MKRLLFLALLFSALCIPASASAQLVPPSVTATAIGPDQIDLTWSAPTGCNLASQSAVVCYGYRVLVQSAGDSRYSSYTQYQFTPNAAGDASDENTDPTCAYCFQPYLNGGALPTWVVEAQYKDWLNAGSAAQAIIFGLKPNTAYNFEVETFRYYTNTVYSAPSMPATATTLNYTLRYVNAATGNDANGGTNSTSDAWLTLFHAGQTATAGQCVIFIGGTYSGDYLWSAHDGTAALTNHIVFMVNPGDTVTITNSPYSDIQISNSYNVVDGITIVNNVSAGANPITITGPGTHSAVFGVSMDSKNGGFGALIGADHSMFAGNYLHDTGNQNVDDSDNLDVLGDTAYSGLGGFNIMQYNHYTRGAHGNVTIKNQNLTTPPTENETLNNIADGGWGNAFGEVDQCNLCTVSAPPINHELEEGNIAAYVWSNHGTQTDFKEPFYDEGNYDTWRRNIAIIGPSNAFEINAYEQSVTNGLIYNNLFYRMGDECWWWGTPAAGQVYTGMRLSNNLCTQGGYNSGGSLQLYYTGAYETDTTLTYNATLYFSGGVFQPNQASISFDAGSTLHTVAYADANNSPPYSNNVAVQLVPTFVDEAHFDFHQLTGSQLVGVGTTVTDTTWGTVGNTNLGAYDGSFLQATAGGFSRGRLP